MSIEGDVWSPRETGGGGEWVDIWTQIACRLWLSVQVEGRREEDQIVSRSASSLRTDHCRRVMVHDLQGGSSGGDN